MKYFCITRRKNEKEKKTFKKRHIIAFKTAILTLYCINVLKEKKYLKFYVNFLKEFSIHFH